LTREERAATGASPNHHAIQFQATDLPEFCAFSYIKVGVHELDQEKLAPLLKLKYNNAIADAVADLGRPEEIGNVFAGFQKYLYQPGTMLSNQAFG